jgi:hypothetical protein
VSPISPLDWSAELQEALWETGKDFGVPLEVSQQVAIARAVSRRPAEGATPEDVRTAFAAINLPRPPAAYAKAVLASVKGVTPSKTLLEVLLDYRRFAIRSLSGQFGGNTRGQEEELRNNLLTYLPTRGYTEARTGRGRTDILLPAPDDVIIEVKVWTNPRTYRDGLKELGRYIHTEQPQQAYMVVFGDRDPLPSIVEEHRQELASTEQLEGLAVPVVVVPFEVDAPSKAAAQQRRRQRGKG